MPNRSLHAKLPICSIYHALRGTEPVRPTQTQHPRRHNQPVPSPERPQDEQIFKNQIRDLGPRRLPRMARRDEGRRDGRYHFSLPRAPQHGPGPPARSPATVQPPRPVHRRRQRLRKQLFTDGSQMRPDRQIVLAEDFIEGFTGQGGEFGQRGRQGQDLLPDRATFGTGREAGFGRRG